MKVALKLFTASIGWTTLITSFMTPWQRHGNILVIASPTINCTLLQLPAVSTSLAITTPLQMLRHVRILQ